MTYDPKALNCWERFELDWEKFWSGTGGKVVAVTVFVAALVLAICCPQFAPILIATVVDIGLTVMLGGITGGLSSVENGGGFWSGFGSYIDENIAIIATSELIIAMATFGISQAVASVKSVQPVKATQAADVSDELVVDGITIRKVRQDELTPEAFREMQSLTHTADGQTKSSITSGKKIHKGFRNTADGLPTTHSIYGAGRTTGMYGYVDSIDTINKVIYELKPNNAKSIAAGIKQLKRYGAVYTDYSLVLVLY